ncbi:unnamed protein product [Rhizoctonia solani]|uniref:Protein kinase domain-containing protein n=1 Tax=Rhizoctonia solani TaxID=456999 RepID=A0A8H3D672_9AGAM|nr:unnamed protein product [Rhizoctonia solani]
MDVTHLLETLSQHPVDGGGSCDIYQGKLHDGLIVALKIERPNPRSQPDGSESSVAQQRMWKMLKIWTECTHQNIVRLIGGAVLQTGIAAVYGWLEYGGIIEYLKRHPTADRFELASRNLGFSRVLDMLILIYLSEHPDMQRSEFFARERHYTQRLEGRKLRTETYYHTHDHTRLLQSYVQTNILVSSDGVPQIHLSPFSCTNLAEDGANNNTSSLNIRWAAPELLLAQSRGTFASDVYALGMTILASGNFRSRWVP